MYMHSQTSIIRTLIVRIFCFVKMCSWILMNAYVQDDFPSTKTLKNAT